jgi:predicted nucleotide-binding protein
MVLENAKTAGFLTEINGQTYVNLDGVPVSDGESTETPDEPEGLAIQQEPAEPVVSTPVAPMTDPKPSSSSASASTPVPVSSNDLALNKRVFVTHGKNAAIVGQLKELLSFGGFIPVVSEENETVSKPVPDKVMDDMRSCGAGIVHVGAEEKLMDSSGNEITRLNQNVLIEIGAAMALFGRNFILLVENGAQLPSNLQGLYEVRYDGQKLDYEATMKLLRAFNDFRSLASR